MSLRVLPTDPADTPALMRLHLAVLAEERWFITSQAEYPFDPFSLLEHIKGVLKRDNCGMWTAWLGTDIVGFATATGGPLRRAQHVARFEVMVRQMSRGQGVGSALTNEVITWARASDTVRKLSLAVFDDNERAIALYRGLGFVEEGRRAGEYREADGSERGDVLMALSV